MIGNAVKVMRIAKNPAAKALGSKGGKKRGMGSTARMGAVNERKAAGQVLIEDGYAMHWHPRYRGSIIPRQRRHSLGNCVKVQF